MMRQAIFSLDALGDEQFQGYTNNDDWNGFACPYFDFHSALTIVAAWQNKGWDAHYDDSSDAFVFSINQDFETGKSEEFEIFQVIRIGDCKYYGIGAFSWTWEEVEVATFQK